MRLIHRPESEATSMRVARRLLVLAAVGALVATCAGEPAVATGSAHGTPVSRLAVEFIVKTGWLEDDPVALVEVSEPNATSLWLRYRPIDRQWEILTSLPYELDDHAAATGQRSVAAVDRGSGIVTITRVGAETRVQLPADPWVAGWAKQGSIQANPSGGYLLSVASVLARISESGDLTIEPAPAGHVVVAGTSDPDRIIVGAPAPENEPWDWHGWQAELWNVRTGELAPIGRLDGTGLSSSVGLGWFGSASRGWWLVRDDGTLEGLADSAGVLAISPDGRSRLSALEQVCPAVGMQPCPVLLQADDWSVTIEGPILASCGASWNAAGALAACAPARPDLHRRARVVVVDPEGRQAVVEVPPPP